ncbi:MAG: AraC family transcriptional regulator [Piscinibacter sp.]|nr:AraC family transcriptional regulator [Piscinibacter sp.]
MTSRTRLPPIDARAPRPAQLRAGPLMHVPVLLREFGVDPAAVLSRAGVDPRWLDDAENPIAFDAAGRLLDACVRATGCAHFGLIAGQRLDERALGAVGTLVRHGDTVGAGLRDLTLYLHLHDRGAVPLLLSLGPTRTAIGYSIYQREVPGRTQIVEGALAVVMQILRRLSGPRWQASEILFAHGAPADPQPYHRFFGAPLRFDAELSAVVFPSRWLAQPVADADPAVRARLEAALQEAARREAGPVAEQVRRALLSSAFADGQAAAPQIARRLGLHERQLRRRLNEEGANFRQIAGEARLAVAQQLLGDTRLPLPDIAAALHYSDVTALSRAFKQWTGQRPAAWRAERANEPPPAPG